jgi:exo-1,4-beta-D-glucosaminidase
MRGRAPAAVVVALALTGQAAAATSPPLPLRDGWQIQSSDRVTAHGDAISTPAFRPTDWYPTSVPATVLAALVANKVYPDPYVGMNLRAIPGTTYPIGRNFSNLAMPADSPFRASWWYRTQFRLPPGRRGQHIALHFDGLNYRANIWLNGRQIAGSTEVVGTYRLFEFDVSDVARGGGLNVLAVEVFPPEPNDLAWTWVDWNPAPPDKNMGLWRAVYVTTSGDVAVRHPHVIANVDTATLARADLSVTAEAHNLTADTVHGTLHGRIDQISFSQAVDLAPHETKVVRFSPDQYSALRVSHPRLWWPADLGTPNLYQLDLDFQIGAASSDTETMPFGIRQITSALNAQGGRQFMVNGRPLLIRGGGWAPDMLLRALPDRQATELRYVRDLHLNTIRMEGKLEDEPFFDLADQYGILVLAGWCCCDNWEQWATWKPENVAIAAASQRDQIRRLRSHPSLLAWLNGSDNPPPPEIERVYVDILASLDWPNPVVSSATAKRTTVSEATGVKMTGPYDWVPPSYWLLDTAHGGALGFNTETSPGAAVPPIESLRKMLSPGHLWPIDDEWNYHAGGGQFKDVQRFTSALNARYGPASGPEEYATKAQLMAYEGERAMFEAYARNAPASTGVIQWMLNNAWPSLIWHLYDYYLRPGGGYFGAKKACEPLHVQYSYDDRSIIVVNGADQPLAAANVSARVFNLDLAETFSQARTMEVAAHSHAQAFVIPDVPGLSTTYFLDLRLSNSRGETLSSNFYWLSTKPDDLDFQRSTWFVTPVTAYADFTALKDLPPAALTSSVRFVRRGDDEEGRVTLSNPGTSLAFFVRLQVAKGPGGEEVLPVLWQDNYVSLLPGETRDVTVTYKVKDLDGARATVVVGGWNVKAAPTRRGSTPRTAAR